MKIIDSIEPNHLVTIEWEMMDAHKYFPLSFVNSVALRSILYPFTVIKTRLQVQKQNSVYRGTLDACVKILKNEGIRGLYRGFIINTFQVGSGICYILTFEKAKHLLTKYAIIKDQSVRSFIGGGLSSLVSQTIITPFDVVSQHMMVIATSKARKNTSNIKFSHYSNPLCLNRKETEKYGLEIAIIRELYKIDGFRGFYRGYFASLCTYVPSSALWWLFYERYSELMFSSLPDNTWHLLIRSCAGMLSGITVSVLTNPLDVFRVNMQVQRLESYSATVRKLWHEEHLCLFRKGLSARVSQNCISSVLISIGYETIKRLSIKDEYKGQIKW